MRRMGKQVIVQHGTGKDLFCYFHIEPSYIADQAKRATTDTVVGELWGLGTGAYKAVMPSYGGWKKYVAALAAKVGVASFEHTCLTTWSAGSQILKTVCRGTDLPDALVSLDGLYGTKPPGSRPGDGQVIFDVEIEAVARYALAAARGERVFVLLHSAISTPYGSSGEVAQLIRAFVERELGREMQPDASVSRADLDGHGFTDALVLGDFHLLEFPGRDAKEHVTEGHLFDEVWRKWIPWATTDGPDTDRAPAPVATPTLPPAAPTIEVGSSGADVMRWQQFLVGQGAAITADGVFGPRTLAATKAFQRLAGIEATGVLDAPTSGVARARGFGAEADATYPQRPSFMPLVTNIDRARVFGQFSFVPAPSPGNAEGIRITDDWVPRNIVTVVIPQISFLQGGPHDGRVQCHRLVAERARELFARWEHEGLLPHLRTWAGSWVPRFVRGSRASLSNHAFGSAFDVNAAWNGLGAAPAATGAIGSVRELVPVANELGWWWGGHNTTRPDGMHFEIARL
jgi:hypothetical protein